MKLQLIDLFLNDVTDCGLYFKNTTRVYHECLELLAQNGYPVILSTGEATKGEPILTCFQPKELIMMIDEAREAAFIHVRTRKDAEEKLRANLKRLDEQRKAEARYYEKHGTKGEF